MTPTQFLATFPEFNQIDTALIAAKLNLAAARMGGPDFTVWPPFAGASPTAQLTLSDLAHGNLAADMLFKSPFGGVTALAKAPTGPSSYYKDFEEAELAVAGGFVVAGGNVGTPLEPPAPGILLQVQTGTVALVNGSMVVTFSTSQVIPAGTVLAFAAQPGAYYTLAIPTNGTSGTLMAPYTGPSNAASTWSAS